MKVCPALALRGCGMAGLSVRPSPQKTGKKKKKGLSFASDVKLAPQGLKLSRSGDRSYSTNIGFLLPFCEYEVRVSLKQIKEDLGTASKSELAEGGGLQGRWNIEQKNVYIKPKRGDSFLEFDKRSDIVLLLTTVAEEVEIRERVTLADAADKRKDIMITLTVRIAPCSRRLARSRIEQQQKRFDNI